MVHLVQEQRDGGGGGGGGGGESMHACNVSCYFYQMVTQNVLRTYDVKISL